MMWKHLESYIKCANKETIKECFLSSVHRGAKRYVDEGRFIKKWYFDDLCKGDVCLVMQRGYDSYDDEYESHVYNIKTWDGYDFTDNDKTNDDFICEDSCPIIAAAPIYNVKPDDYGWIYLVINIQAVGCLVKVGMTKNDPKKRVYQINASASGVLSDYILYYSVNVNHYKEVEKIIHKKFKHERVKKEWFYVSPIKIIDYITELALSGKVKINKFYPGTVWPSDPLCPFERIDNILIYGSEGITK